MHQCQYKLVTPSADDPSKMLPALKPTKWMTNSSIMADQLNKKCKFDHEHQHLVGGRCKDAAFYPLPFVKAIIKGISLQAAADQKMSQEEENVDPKSPIFAIPMPSIWNPPDFKTFHLLREGEFQGHLSRRVHRTPFDSSRH